LIHWTIFKIASTLEDANSIARLIMRADQFQLSLEKGRWSRYIKDKDFHFNPTSRLDLIK
jgi:hypothetical protein